MDAAAILTVSAAVIGLVQLVKWSGLPTKLAPLAVAVISALGVGLWGWSMGTFERTAAFDYFAAWIAVATSAAGVFGFIRESAEGVTAMRRSTVALVLACGLALGVTGCASKLPPSLSTAGQHAWRANEAVVALATVQDVAIKLNGIERCEPPAACAPLLSDGNTAVVVDAVRDASATIGAVPGGWQQTALEALSRISARLDRAGTQKLKAYVDAARAVLSELLKG